MSGDPEWFYSSLAQSSAAVVGLMGGVLGSRIVDRIGQLRNAHATLDPLIDTASTNIFNYNDWIILIRDHARREIERDQQALAERTRNRQGVRTFGWGREGTANNVVEDLPGHQKEMERQLE